MSSFSCYVLESFKRNTVVRLSVVARSMVVVKEAEGMMVMPRENMEK